MNAGIASKWRVYFNISVGLVSLFFGRCLADDYYVMPFDVDPAVVIDGDINDWANVANPITLRGKEHVVHGIANWSGNEDLSGIMHLAWRGGGIFIVAVVVDDKISQPYTAGDIYKGDHINLWIDFTPGAEPERQMFGAGQFHVVISPGNLDKTEGEKVNPAVIYVYRPEGLKQQGGQVAVKRTDSGYILEAFIPFTRVGVAGVKRDQDVNFEVAFSDSDQLPAAQEVLMTYGTTQWHYARKRLLPMVFGDGNGKGASPVRAKALVAEAKIAAGESMELKFTAEKIPQGKNPYVFFKARMNRKKTAGFVAGAIALEVNGKQVEGKRVSNRPQVSTIMAGKEYTLITNEGEMAAWYTPDFEAVEKHPQYALIDRTKACEYEFVLDGLIKEGENSIVFKNLAQVVAGSDMTITLGDIEYRVRQQVPPPPPLKDAPTGEIPVLEPKKRFPKTYSWLKKSDGKIQFRVNWKKVDVESRFSTPDGKWNVGSNSFFDYKREIIEHDEWIEVRDTFKNLTDKDLPIMQEHSCRLGENSEGVWLSGVKVPCGNGIRREPQNPSVFATTKKIGIGMLPLNDEFIVHIGQSSDDGTIAIKDRQFYLPVGKEYTAEFAIVPVDKPDFWAFVNAARRLRDVNFQLKWCFAFMFHKEPVYKWTDDTFKSFVDNKYANLLVKSIYDVRTKKGKPARCTDWTAGPHTVYTDLIKRVKEFYPDGEIKTGIYFHCFLDTTDENAERFKDDRALDDDGNHLDYGGKGGYMKIYVPTLEKGSWGDEIAKVMDKIFELGADGIFWDEFSYSRVKYIYNKLDGCSADIDSKTFKIIRPKGAMSLLSLDWRVKQVKRILDAGRPFIINGAPVTCTMNDFKFQAFTETGLITNCRRMLLHSPVALGDHLTERKYTDSYDTMLKALDHGCLYVWYGHIFHTHKAPTYYMYPFTPIELHSGYVFGEERIVTKTSGYFGWGDNSDFEVHIFDRDGKETSEIKTQKVKRAGKTYAEMRLPENYYAIIIRK